MAVCRVSRGCRSAATSRHDATRPRSPHRTLDRALAVATCWSGASAGWHGRGVPRRGAGPRAPSRHQAAVPLKAADSRARRRFLDEARTVARLSHPNIVPVFAVDESPDACFFVMAYVEGQTLANGSATRECSLRRRCAAVARGGTGAGACARARRRTPRRETRQHPARRATGRALYSISASPGGRDGARRFGGVVGTADYMSPRQASGLGVDARSDLYSLGVWLPRAVGPAAVRRPRRYRCWRAHRRPPAAARVVAPHVPRRLAQVVDRCLHKEPAPLPERRPSRRSGRLRVCAACGATHRPAGLLVEAVISHRSRSRTRDRGACARPRHPAPHRRGPGPESRGGLIGWLLVLPVVMTWRACGDCAPRGSIASISRTRSPSSWGDAGKSWRFCTVKDRRASSAGARLAYGGSRGGRDCRGRAARARVRAHLGPARRVQHRRGGRLLAAVVARRAPSIAPSKG